MHTSKYGDKSLKVFGAYILNFLPDSVKHETSVENSTYLKLKLKNGLTQKTKVIFEQIKQQLLFSLYSKFYLQLVS